MKLAPSIIFLLGASLTFADSEQITQKFYDELEIVRANYRKDFSKELRKCDRVVIYLVDFDDVQGMFDPFDSNSGDEKPRIRIHPYGNDGARILQGKELSESDKQKLLNVLANQLEVETQYGGAFCHFPIHGIKAYSQEQLLLESTFCWLCGNFGFNYPTGTQWLDTSQEMKEVFNDILPIPDSEMERFKKKYPSALKEEESEAK